MRVLYSVLLVIFKLPACVDRVQPWNTPGTLANRHCLIVLLVSLSCLLLVKFWVVLFGLETQLPNNNEYEGTATSAVGKKK